MLFCRGKYGIPRKFGKNPSSVNSNCFSPSTLYFLQFNPVKDSMMFYAKLIKILVFIILYPTATAPKEQNLYNPRIYPGVATPLYDHQPQRGVRKWCIAPLGLIVSFVTTYPRLTPGVIEITSFQDDPQSQSPTGA
jgi:hypothetical protein